MDIQEAIEQYAALIDAAGTEKNHTEVIRLWGEFDFIYPQKSAHALHGLIGPYLVTAFNENRGQLK